MLVWLRHSPLARVVKVIVSVKVIKRKCLLYQGRKVSDLGESIENFWLIDWLTNWQTDKRTPYGGTMILLRETSKPIEHNSCPETFARSVAAVTLSYYGNWYCTRNAHEQKIKKHTEKKMKRNRWYHMTIKVIWAYSFEILFT